MTERIFHQKRKTNWKQLYEYLVTKYDQSIFIAEKPVFEYFNTQCQKSTKTFLFHFG